MFWCEDIYVEILFGTKPRNTRINEMDLNTLTRWKRISIPYYLSNSFFISVANYYIIENNSLLRFCYGVCSKKVYHLHLYNKLNENYLFNLYCQTYQIWAELYKKHYTQPSKYETSIMANCYAESILAETYFLYENYEQNWAIKSHFV